MSAEPIRLRTSCLIERARACAAGFEAIGHDFSAKLTRKLADDLDAGTPPALMEHWITEQEERLRVKRAERVAAVRLLVDQAEKRS